MRNFILVDDCGDIVDEVKKATLKEATTHFKRNVGLLGCNQFALRVYEYKKSFSYEVVE